MIFADGVICLLKGGADVGIIYRYEADSFGEAMDNSMKSILNLFRDNEQGVQFCVIALIIVGTLNIYSASYVASGMSIVVRQLGWAAIGLGFMYCIVRRVNYLRTEGFGMGLTWISIILCLLVRFVGVEINGAQRWLDLGIVQFQPSEIAKLASAWLAASYVGRTLRNGEQLSLINKELALILVMGIIVYFQPDMGTAAIIMAIGIMVYVIGGLNRRQMVTLGVGGIASLIVLALLSEYRRARILSWLGITEDAQGTDYQADQAQMVIGSGGFSGAGWGDGLSKYNYLPESHTDFAFAVFCEEWGFLLTVIFVFLPFVLFTYYGFRIAIQTEEFYGKMIAVGMTLLISGQAVSNMLMVMGVFPVIGVPLPFISYGGTSLIINLICVGLLLSIDRKNKFIALAKQKREEEQETAEN